MKWNDPKHTLAMAVTMLARLGAKYHVTYEGNTYTTAKLAKAAKTPRRKLVDRYNGLIYDIPLGGTVNIPCADRQDFSAMQRAVTGRLTEVSKQRGAHYTHHTKNEDGSYILHVTRCLPLE